MHTEWMNHYTNAVYFTMAWSMTQANMEVHINIKTRVKFTIHFKREIIYTAPYGNINSIKHTFSHSF